ncbi:MAG: cytosine permease [Deltaproteobacteria bacterium]|nr:cytosine permease [Deltaproteobacteria bacterium]
MGGFDYLSLWSGVGISLAEIWAGGFLAPMGFWAGFWAIIIGHVIGNSFMSLGGVIGSDHGIMAMVAVRPAFGIRGSNLAAALNIIQLIGWASIMLIIGGRAGAYAGPVRRRAARQRSFLDCGDRSRDLVVGASHRQADLEIHADGRGDRPAAGDHPDDLGVGRRVR